MSRDKDLLKEIKKLVDYQSFYGKYLNFEIFYNGGNQGLAKCPFHDDTNPSLSVDFKEGVWHCFGCDKSGDVFSFIQELEKLSFNEAVEKLAEEVGIRLNDKKENKQSKETKKFKQSEKPKNLQEDIKDLSKKFSKSGFYVYKTIERKAAYRKWWFREVKEEFKEKIGRNKTFLKEPLIPDFAGSGKSLLFNLPELTKPNLRFIFLTEGEKDCLNLQKDLKESYNQGISAEFTPDNTAVIGYNNFEVEFQNSECSEFFLDKIVYIFVDADEPGRKKAFKAVEVLQDYAKEIYLVEPGEGKNDGYDISDFLAEGHPFLAAITFFSKRVYYRRWVEISDLLELENLDIPESQYISFLKIPESNLALLVGQGGVGKSLFLLFLALELAQNGYFVAYLSLEDSLNTLLRRVKYLKRRKKFKIQGKLRLEEVTAVENLKGYLMQKLEKLNNTYQIFIIDPIGSVFEDENSNPEIQKFLRQLQLFCSLNEKNIILSHHLRKQKVEGKENRFDLYHKVRGASSFVNNCRAVYLAIKEGEYDLKVRTLKNNYGSVNNDFLITNLFSFEEPLPIEIKKISQEVEDVSSNKGRDKSLA